MAKKPSRLDDGKSRTSGIAMPHAEAAWAMANSWVAMSAGSCEEGNLTIHGSSSMSVNIFGRAPPDEPPKA